MNETTINNKSIDTSINRKSVFVKRPENNNDICFQIKNIVFPFSFIRSTARKNNKSIFAYFDSDGWAFGFSSKGTKIDVQNINCNGKRYIDSRYIADFLSTTNHEVITFFFPKQIASYISFMLIESHFAKTFIKGYIKSLQSVKHEYISESFSKTVPTEINKEGYVYFIYDYTRNRVKIGKSKNPKTRITDFKIANPGIELLYSIKTDNYTKLEKDFHNLFNNKRIVGEWFNFSITELKEIFPDISKDFDYAASPYLEEKRFREVYA